MTWPLAPGPPCERVLTVVGAGCWAVILLVWGVVVIASPPPAPRIHPASSCSQQRWGVLVRRLRSSSSPSSSPVVVSCPPPPPRPVPSPSSLSGSPAPSSSSFHAPAPLHRPLVVPVPSPCHLCLLRTSLTPYEQLLVAEGSGAVAWSSRWWCWVPGCARRFPRIPRPPSSPSSEGAPAIHPTSKCS